MSIHDFDFQQKFTNIDKLPDHRSDAEKFNSKISVYNHDSEDLAYAERLAEEIINISGAVITVFKRRRNEAGGDEVWEEDADPTYKHGVRIKGRFAPEPAEISLTRWGVDVPNQTTISFARAVILKQFGKEMIAEGDVLVVPHNTLIGTQFTDIRDGASNRMDQYRVLKSGDAGNFKYRWIYWNVLAEALSGDDTIQVDFRKEPRIINV